MKEKTFLDRVPTHPGRVILTPVSGNTYDMVRADSPTVEGTPIDKAAFDSIIQSRLTGRYYTPDVTRVITSIRSDITVSPIPRSGWAGTATNKVSGNYAISTSSNPAATSYPIENAFDGNEDTQWVSDANRTHWLAFSMPTKIKVKKIKVKIGISGGVTASIKLQGSNDGTNWVELKSGITASNVSEEYSLSATGEYTMYRLYCALSSSGAFYVSEFQPSNYDITTFSNKFTLSAGVPSTWDNGQRLMIETSAETNAVGIINNTLNGITVDTILQPSRRYELRYTGSAFVAKEV